MINQQKSVSFTLSDVYQFEQQFRTLFPENRHVRPKIRQTLQRLRDIGFIDFVKGGEYRLNTSFDDLELEPDIEQTAGFVIPQSKQVVRNIRLRNTLLSSEMKRRYEHVCQICGNCVDLAHGKYSEAHHIRPLGMPHLGSDRKSVV